MRVGCLQTHATGLKFNMLRIEGQLFWQVHGDWESQMRRVMKMIAGGGLTITGSHNLCGDYLYSGHTVMLTLTYLFMKECE